MDVPCFYLEFTPRSALFLVLLKKFLKRVMFAIVDSIIKDIKGTQPWLYVYVLYFTNENF